MLKFAGKIIIWSFAVIGLLVVLLTAGGVFYAKSRAGKPPKPPEKIVLVFNFKDALREKPEDVSDIMSLVESLRSRRDAPSLHDIVQALHRGAKDPRVVGVVGLFSENMPDMAQTQEILPALRKFREAGKFSYAFSTSYGTFGPGNKAYYLASGFEQVWLQPVGTLGLSGMRLESPFARATLDKIGVKAHFVQREEYKSAMSMLTDDTMPGPMREEMQAILHDLTNQLANGIAQGRKMSFDEARALMAKGPYTAQEALDKKLIDKIGYSDEIEKIIDEKHGKKAAKMGAARYLSLPPPVAQGKPQEAARLKETVALIVAEGEITDMVSDVPNPLTGGERGMDTGEIVNAFEAAANDKKVKVIVFRVNSPGGSPTASESIRRALVLAQEKGKKVIVSMGAMAGSGGYWIAMNGDRIFATPATLTGSIGVVGGKIDLAGLYEKIGLRWEALTTGDYTGMWSVAGGYTPEERVRVEAMIDDTYNAFRAHVAKARAIPPEKMPGVSKGRVFTGAQAVKLGLVDELGGMVAAIHYAKASLKLAPEDEVIVKLFPRHISTGERLQGFLRDMLDVRAGIGPGVTFDALRQWARQSVQSRMAAMPVFRVE